MLSGVRVGCIFIDTEGHLQDGSLELDFDPNSDKTVDMEVPYMKITLNIDDLKRAIRQLEVL